LTTRHLPGARTTPNRIGAEKGLIAACLAAALAAQPDPFEANVQRVVGADQIVLGDGRRVRLSGLALPGVMLRLAETAPALSAFLRERLERRDVWLFPETENERGDPSDLTAVVRHNFDGPSVNEAALRAGLALYSCRTPRAREGSVLLAAAREAQRDNVGWYKHSAPRRFGPADELPLLNGAVLGLHDRAQGSYAPRVDELADAGFRHLCLLLAAFLPGVDGMRIDRFHRRTVRDDRLIETIRRAKERGMSVMLLPIVLLEEADQKDWRGTIRPQDEALFWLAYDAFLSHYLDVAQKEGVEIVSIGSEFGSLEGKYDAWMRVIENARGRYAGLLTYSANWDHAQVPRFFRDLDFVGMTAYFSLTKKDDPALDDLIAAWQRIAKESVAPLAAQHGKPIVFTELGYASLDGINKDPWNYVMKTPLDLQEQKDCLDAFLEVVPQMPWLKGAYFFDYFSGGGPKDKTYSPRGKPAMESWRRWAAWGK
jgi:hypothetical protein